MFPQLSAGPNFHAVITRGKFHCTDIGQELTVGARLNNHISLFLENITPSLMISDSCTLIRDVSIAELRNPRYHLGLVTATITNYFSLSVILLWAIFGEYCMKHIISQCITSSSACEPCTSLFFISISVYQLLPPPRLSRSLFLFLYLSLSHSPLSLALAMTSFRQLVCSQSYSDR